MKKIKTQKKESLKLKDHNFKYLKLARILCLLFIVLFMAFVGLLMFNNSLGYQAIIVKYPALTAGFLVCVINLYIYFVTRNMIKDLDEGKYIDQSKLRICLYTFSQFILFNYPSAILMGLTLYKNFDWKQSSLNASLKYIRIQKELKFIVIDLLVLTLMMLLSLWFVMAFSR